MRVARLRKAEQPLQNDLPGCVVEQIGAAHNMRDSLGGIIDDDGKYIGNNLIASFENDVADRGGHLLAEHALDAILECDVARFYPQSCGHSHSRKHAAAAARAGIALLIFQLQAAAGTRKRQIALVQALQRFVVLPAAITLMNHRSIPFEAKFLECAQDIFGRARSLPRPIEILHAQQPAAAMGAGIEITGCRRI